MDLVGFLQERKAGSEWTRTTIELNKDQHYPGLSDKAMT